MASIPMRHPDDRSGERSGRVPIGRSTLERIKREHLKREQIKREEQLKSHQGQSYRIIDKIWNGIKGGGWRPKPPTVPGGKPPRGSKGTGGKGQGEKGTGGKGEGEKNPSGDAPPPATGGGGGGGDPPEDPSRGGSDRAPPAPGGGGDPPEDPTRGRSSSATPGNKSDGIRNVGSGSAVSAFRGYRGPYYRLPPRAEIKALKKQLKQAVDAFNRGSKCFNTSTEQLRAEREKLKKLIAEYAEVVKAGIDNEVAMVNITRENAAELKALVEELTEAVKSSKTGNISIPTNFQKFFRTEPVKVCRNLTFFALAATTVLVAAGYIELGDPCPFSPMKTKAGKLLYDNYTFGLQLKCTSSFTQTDNITYLLTGGLDALQSQGILKHIEEKWSCQIGVSPGHDVVFKGGMRDIGMNGLKVGCNIPLYDGLHRKLEFKKKFRFGLLEGKLGLNENPLLSLTAMFGSKMLSGGGFVDFDSVPAFLRRLGVGGSFSMFGFSASLMMEKLFNVQAAGQQPHQVLVSHQVTGTVHWKASEATAVGAILTHRLEANETSLAVGVEHCVDSVSSVKCRLNNQFIFTAMMQHRIGDKAVVSLTGEVDLRALQANPRTGLSFSFAA